MIKITDTYALNADKYQFILMKKTQPKDDNEPTWKPEGYYPTMSTLIRGLSDRHLYDAVRRCASLKAIQEDLVSWANGFKTPLVGDLKDAVRLMERESDNVSEVR